jgi:CRP/FNR family cyclic AMP-dependent transcriptional regulator
MPTLHTHPRSIPVPAPTRIIPARAPTIWPPVEPDRDVTPIPHSSERWGRPEPAIPLGEFLARMPSVTRRFDRKQVVIQKGDRGCFVYTILSGRVKVTAPSLEGRELTFTYLGPGEFFGEVAIVEGTAHTATVTTIEPTVFQLIDGRDFLRAISDNPRATLSLMAILCARLRRASELAEDLSFLALPVRLAKTLLSLVDSHGIPVSNGTRIGLQLCQQELANLVVTSRESVNKQLRSWEEAGVISLKAGGLTILRLSALRALVPQDV